ncbi:MAG: polyhydroxyalkanoate synthesis repressor PhaR [Methyloligellaceae bacterium]
MRKDKRTENGQIVIKKYANRRLYNTDTSAYVTLDDLAQMVRSERDFVVFDAKTGEDLTHAVLTQIIVEQESKGENLLPVPFLRQLIKFYGDNFGRLVPTYLEMSLNNLTKEQDKYRNQFESAFGANPLEAMQEHAKKNMAVFEQTMSMFSPFTPPSGDEEEESKKDRKKGDNSVSDELKELKSQLSSMQKKIDELS